MLILLPPSETKRDGGPDGAAELAADVGTLDLAALSFPSLTPARRATLAAVRTLSTSVAASTAALGLGPTQRFEIERNRAVRTSPVLPAIERYTGVLYDAIGVQRLDPAARAYLRERVVIHSALFGLVGAGDLIPAYRLSHDSRLPGTSLARLWRDANTAVLADEPGLVLDLRSEGYVRLGLAGERSWFLRVVTASGDGNARALNHFNKHGKGELVRALALADRDFADVGELLEWAADGGPRLSRGIHRELRLEV